MGFAARYDLGSQPSTYDFFTWLVHVQGLGASEIVIDTRHIKTSKWPVTETRKRLANYLLPGPTLAGLPAAREGSEGERCGSHMVQDLMRLRQPFARLRSTAEPRSWRYTVTLRETFHRPEKNSERSVWMAFADEIGAVVIEDHSVYPLLLEARVALYAGAQMNFGVTNGPMTLCTMTPYPAAIFCDPETTAQGFRDHGIEVGQQYPYAQPNQRLIWERPTLAGLMRAYDAMCT